MPQVSAVIAVHDDAAHIRAAVVSVLRQTVTDLELIVVDDASTDETPALLAGLDDERLRVIRNEQQLGLAASLNVGLEHATGRYVARLDSDDAAFPDWLDSLLARIGADPPVAIVGTGIVEVDVGGRPGPVHVLPRGATAVRWHALFSAPFFHSTVLIDGEVLERHALRYDPGFLESEDYELWARLLAVADGDNLRRALVLRRMHPGQAQARRGELQRSFQRQVALREIGRVAPALRAAEAELAWRLGSGQPIDAGESETAVEAYLALLRRFEGLNGVDGAVRAAVARRLARAGARLRGVRLSPTLPADLLVGRARRRVERRHVHRRGEAWLSELTAPPGRPLRVAVVSPEPTPYRSPLFDRIGERPEIDLTVIYAARTVAGRTWTVQPRHRAVFLRGARVPGLARVVRHDYPLTLGIGRALRSAGPDVVVVSGWSTFASQAAIAWCRARGIRYVLHVESHDLERRPGWRRAVKGAVVPRLLRGAAGVLVVGTAARESVVSHGARPERVRVFANTIDIERWIERAETLARRPHDGVLVLSVGRDVPEKGFDVLARACDDAGVMFEKIAGGVPEDELARRYVEADVFALLSRHEPWGVVVNEAAASGLPLVLSEYVGAARDLLRDGENGFLVPADDVAAAAAALRKLAADPELRRRMGDRSRELVRGWGYEPSAESFLAAVREAGTRTD